MAERWPNFSPWEFRSRDMAQGMTLDVRLLDGLQALRDLVKVPITVNSGFRTDGQNRKIGGSPRSQHLLGKAADIWGSGIPQEKLKTAATRVAVFEGGGIGVYQSFVHVDVRWERVRWRG